MYPVWPHYKGRRVGWLGVGEGRGKGGGGEAPHEDIVLNITKYLQLYIVLPSSQLVEFLAHSTDLIGADLFLEKIRPCAGRKLLENLMMNTSVMQS